jgi:DNA-binding SARP family transcriptional activator
VLIALFGQPGFFSRKSEPLKVTLPEKALELLAFLILNRAAPVSREAVAFTLWPDEVEAAAFANLRRTLHVMRRALPFGETLVVEPALLWWNERGSIAADVAEFERLAGTDPAAALELARSGDLLPHCDEDWVRVARERLRARRVELLERLLFDAERRGDHRAAASAARGIFEVDPWREDVLRALMRARNGLGDRAGAIAECAAFTARIAAELGIEPMPETLALRAELSRSRSAQISEIVSAGFGRAATAATSASASSSQTGPSNSSRRPLSANPRRTGSIGRRAKSGASASSETLSA